MTTTIDSLAGATQLHWADYLVLVIYFVGIIAVGIWSSCKNRGSVSGYFLAGRNMNWILVGASLYASNIGSGHFVGLAGSGASMGIASVAFEFNAIYALLVLGWLFLPVYMASGIYTVPEYIGKRFDGVRIRIYLSVLSLIMYIFIKMSADLYAGAVFIRQSIGWDIWGSITGLLVLSAIFTIAGGLNSVIWIELVQTAIMLIGAIILAGLSFHEVGGYQNAIQKFSSSAAWSNLTAMYMNGSIGLNDSERAFARCGLVPENFLHIFRPADDPNFPWPGILIGGAINSLWYWCTDQVIDQRALAAKNLLHAKAATILAGYLKILPLFIMIFPGMIARVLFSDLVGCSDPEACQRICGNRGGCTNIAYPLLVVKLLPVGLRGLILVVVMCALMSSLASTFNSSSTLFTMDIWMRIRKNAGEMEQLVVGRLFTLVMVAISVGWVPVVQNVPELFNYIQSMTSYLSPPVFAVYLLAIMWTGITEAGAFWGLIIGLACGVARFIAEYSYGPPSPCGIPDPRPAIISKVQYLHFGMILFAIVTAITSIISLFTKPMDKKKLARLTYFTRHCPPAIENADVMAMQSIGPSKATMDRCTTEAAIGEEGASEKGSSATVFSCQQMSMKTGDSTTRLLRSDATIDSIENPGANIRAYEQHPVGDIGTTMEQGQGDQRLCRVNQQHDLADERGQMTSSRNLEKSSTEPRFSLSEPEAEPVRLDRVAEESRAVSRPWYKKVLYWVCGIENLNLEAEARVELMHTCIDEAPFWRMIINFNAVIIMLITMFVIGYYA